ncbi:MAG: N-6 DNA methylase [Candidatus Burarchaeum sp.]|nr:N-6 DNA methylase [Candidatus Burarchaeum sp.]MDO8339292.1 N-6 DNA methylase [Candidatus Burarchaeum sp.]
MAEITKEEAKQKVAELLEDWRREHPQGPPRTFNEENTKQWIDELFHRLGWNLRTDLSKEERSGRRKRVDYAFKIEGTVQFLLEAKKPSENLDDHIDQAVEYGYQNSKKWVVLTNFEEIRIYNSEYWKEAEQTRRLVTPLKITDFLTRFDDLWLLSKPAFEERLIEKIAAQYGKAKPKEPITKILSDDMERWRKLLTKGISEHRNLNKIPSEPEQAEEYIDEMVQRILDRILFIRVAEDRGIEEPVLENALRNWQVDKSKPLSEYLRHVFRKMDDIYNSGIFREHESEKLTIDNESYRQIIDESYKSPTGLKYNFDAIDADILGCVYEQYLSILLKKTAKRTSLKASKGKRKEQGIYYTPTYIVDYIVKNALGEMLKDKKPEEVARLKVLDPTCGSGSFLIKAFDEIKSYYKNQKGQQKLNVDSQILTQNIYGVDLDSKAVEIARLNLLLKAAETKHKLPELNNNLKQGNSFIESEAIAGDKAFKWEKQFASVFTDGRFDVIIGNPPYVHQKGEKDAPKISYLEREYYRQNYTSVYSNEVKTRGGIKLNLFVPYVERTISLLKPMGFLGFIVHKNVLKVESYKLLRKYILDNCSIEQIVDLGAGVFSEVTGETVIMILKKEPNSSKRNGHEIKIRYGLTNPADLLNNKGKTTHLKQENFQHSVDHMFAIYVDERVESLKNKLSVKSKKLDEVARIVSFGLNTKDNKKYLSFEKLNGAYKPVVLGRDVGKYVLRTRNRFVLYESKVLDRVGDLEAFNSPEKLIFQRIGSGLIGVYDDERFYCFNSTNMILPKQTILQNQIKLKYLLGILNSKLMNYYYRAVFSTESSLTVNVTQGYLSQLPIKMVSEQEQEPVIKLVDKILALNRRLFEIGSKKTDERAEVEAEIQKSDAEIDDLVYKLYGLTEEERKMVEKNTTSD